MGTLSLASCNTRHRPATERLEEARPGRLLCDTSLLGRGEVSTSCANQARPVRIRTSLREPREIGSPQKKRVNAREHLRPRGVPIPYWFLNGNPRFAPGHMDQQPLEDVVFSQVRAPHAAGVVPVGECPLSQLGALPQQPRAPRPLQPSPIRRDQSLLIFLAYPAPSRPASSREYRSHSRGRIRWSLGPL